MFRLQARFNQLSGTGTIQMFIDRLSAESLNSSDYRVGSTVVPALHASAARGVDGKMHLAIANLDPQHSVQISVRAAGAHVGKCPVVS